MSFQVFQFKMSDQEDFAAIIKTKNKRTQKFKWTPKMIEYLILSIGAYKFSMEFKNIDFDADKNASVRKTMGCHL